MDNFKIIISPAKTFNKNALPSSRKISTMFAKESKAIFAKIYSLNNNDLISLYNVSDKIFSNIVQYKADWNKKTYEAISLFDGMVFKELVINEENKEWVNDHVLILDALYGLIRPNDYISKYRLDFNTKINLDLKEIWSKKVNDYLKDFKVYSLASKEYTNLLTIPFIEIETDKDIKQIKKARGIKLNQLIKAM